MDGPRWKRLLLLHVYVLPVIAVAFWLRFAGISKEHLYGDEAEYAIVARYLMRDWTFLAYPDISSMGPMPFVSQPPLVLYAMAVSMKVLGATDFAALLPSVLFGVATVVAVYATGFRLGGRLMGLSAAALMAVMPFHVEMSRRAMLDAGYVFFLALTMYFCVAWLQDRSRRAAVGVGVATACVALAKLPGALAGPAVVLVLLVGLGVTLVQRMRGTAPERAVGETLLQGALGFAPVAIGAALYLGLLAKLQALGNLWVKLIWQFGRVDTSRAQVQEVTAIHRDASFYFVDPKFSFAVLLGGTLFAIAVVGLIALLVRLAIPRLARPEDSVVPIFLLVMLGFFLYSDRKEGFYLLPFAPMAALLIAYAADSLHRMLRWAGVRWTPGAARGVGYTALAVAVVLVLVPGYAAASVSVSQFVQGQTGEKYFGYGTQEAAAWIHENDPDAAIYGTLLGRFGVHWYNEQPVYHWYIDHTFVESQIKAGKLRYVVYDEYIGLPFDREYMRELIVKYNGQKVQQYKPCEQFKNDASCWGQGVSVFELHP